MPNKTNTRLAMTVHVKHHSYDVYGGRPGKWQNPWPINRRRTRGQVIHKYLRHLQKGIREVELTWENFKPLVGKRIGCHCWPKPCHVDILVYIVNKMIQLPTRSQIDLVNIINSIQLEPSGKIIEQN